MIVMYDHQNIFIVQATSILQDTWLDVYVFHLIHVLLAQQVGGIRIFFEILESQPLGPML